MDSQSKNTEQPSRYGNIVKSLKKKPEKPKEQ